MRAIGFRLTSVALKAGRRLMTNLSTSAVHDCTLFIRDQRHAAH